MNLNFYNLNYQFCDCKAIYHNVLIDFVEGLEGKISVSGFQQRDLV